MGAPAAIATSDAALRLLRLARHAADALEDAEPHYFEADARAERAFRDAPTDVLEALAAHVLACDRVCRADTEALGRALDEITRRSGRGRRAVIEALAPRRGVAS